MPRKRKSDPTAAEEEVAVPEKRATRRSTRIAEAAVVTPEVTTPKKAASKRGRKPRDSASEEATASPEKSVNDPSESNEEAPVKAGSPSTKAASQTGENASAGAAANAEENGTSALDQTAEKQLETPDDVDAASSTKDYEHVAMADVPAADSHEVKSAIAAQGEDGQLLTDYIQVARDELPDADSHEVKHAIAKSTSTSRPDTNAEGQQNSHPSNGIPNERADPSSETSGLTAE